MQVKIISLTKPMIEGLEMNLEEYMVYVARVSNPSNQENLETSAKLLKYLLTNKHWSPLDMADMTVEVKTSRAIAQQILRHWSHRFQEFSQRYAAATEREPIELRRKGKTNRQSSEDAYDPILENHNGRKASNVINEKLDEIKELYDELLAHDVSSETARFILPLATTTTIYMKASVRSWFHYLEQRLDKHTQKEHRQVAEKVLEIFAKQFPNLAPALQYEKI